MRREIPSACNNSEYFLYQSPDDFLMNETGTMYQQREYFVCGETLDVLMPGHRYFLPERQRVVVASLKTNAMHDIVDAFHFGERQFAPDTIPSLVVYHIYEKRKCLFPADWFPGICDAWVKAHAGDADSEPIIYPEVLCG